MSRKLFWLKLIVLPALLALSLGSIQAQITGFIPVFVDGSGTEDASVIFQDFGTGNIGIGTTSPTNQLEIVGASNALALGDIGCGAGMGTIAPMGCGNYQFLGQSNGSTFINSSGLGGIHFRHNNVEANQMSILPNGNVGIGTTTPDAQLDVITPSFRAVHGQSSAVGADAIIGDATATTGASDGVVGRTNSLDGRGVVARSKDNLPANLGLQVFGRGRATGGFSTGFGSVEIDHPFDPANKYLHHSFVGSPDMKNIYDGVVVLDDNGEALVDLPEWFEAINRDFRYQLTCIGGFAPVYVAEKISGNRFKISGGQPGLEVSWQVSGIRKDPYAEKYRVRVEEEKPAIEKGLYLHPDVYGQPQTKSVQ